METEKKDESKEKGTESKVTVVLGPNGEIVSRSVEIVPAPISCQLSSNEP